MRWYWGRQHLHQRQQLRVVRECLCLRPAVHQRKMRMQGGRNMQRRFDQHMHQRQQLWALRVCVQDGPNLC